LIEDIWLNAPSRYGGSGDAPEQGIRPERGLLDCHSMAWMLFQILPRSGQFERWAAILLNQGLRQLGGTYAL
jgi:hypothetical protein